MRTTIELPDDLLRRAKAQAALDGTTLKDLITRWVEDGLRRISKPSVEEDRPKRSELPIARETIGQPLPVSAGSDLQRILDEEEIRENKH